MKRVLGIGVAWAAVWLAFWLIVGAILGFLDPASIDPEEQWLILAIFGPMGLVTGIVFGFLFSRRKGSTTPQPAIHVAGVGVVCTAIVQVAYLGHGDAGLAANVLMALLISVFGGVVTLAWYGAARLLRQSSRLG